MSVTQEKRDCVTANRIAQTHVNSEKYRNEKVGPFSGFYTICSTSKLDYRDYRLDYLAGEM